MIGAKPALATLLILAGSFASAETLRASNVTTVDCNSGQSLNATLAKLNKNVANTVSVSGTCSELVQVNGFSNLTLQGQSGATLLQPVTTVGTLFTALLFVEASHSVTVDGFAIQTDTVTMTAVGIGHGSSDIRLRHLNVTGGTEGISVFENSQASIAYVTGLDPGYTPLGVYDSSDVHVEHCLFSNTSGAQWHVGMDVGASHVTMYATTISNMQIGINAYGSSVIDILYFDNYYNTGGSTDVTIVNPALTNFNGVEVQNGGSLNVTGARLVINQAGQTFGGTTGGVLVMNNSALNTSNGDLVIRGSLGQGVVALNNAHANLTGVTVTGGGHGGLVAGNVSSIDVSTTGTQSTVSGNSMDLFCDANSAITGSANVAGAPKTQCTNLMSTETVTLP